VPILMALAIAVMAMVIMRKIRGRSGGGSRPHPPFVPLRKAGPALSGGEGV
jgi:hypothetical protein